SPGGNGANAVPPANVQKAGSPGVREPFQRPPVCRLSLRESTPFRGSAEAKGDDICWTTSTRLAILRTLLRRRCSYRRKRRGGHAPFAALAVRVLARRMFAHGG